MKALSICLSLCFANVVFAAESVSAVHEPSTWVMVSTALVLFIGSSMSRRVQG